MGTREAGGFAIEFDKVELPLGRGRITLGDFTEVFEADLGFWSPGDYERQWREAVGRIVSGQPRSALITSVTDPATANFIIWWPMYLVEDVVAVQNQLLFMADLTSPLDPSNPYEMVRERCSVSEDGERISEWEVSVEVLTRWLNGR